jgi:hypothetical protein
MKEIIRTDLCFGCDAKTNSECLMLVKDSNLIMHLYSIEPEKCICKDCIVKMVCKKFCEKMEELAPTIGTEVNV